MSAVRKEVAAQGGGLEVTDAEIDAVILEAAGDPREAIRMLLQDLGTMELDVDAAASRGFLRGRSQRERDGGRMRTRGSSCGAAF